MSSELQPYRRPDTARREGNTTKRRITCLKHVGIAPVRDHRLVHLQMCFFFFLELFLVMKN